MRASVLDGDLLVRDASGSPALFPHPKTGHLVPAFTWECVVTLDGKPCPCAAADEEAGTVEVWTGEWRELRTLHGDVEIRVTPISDECGCPQCCPGCWPGCELETSGP